MPISFSSDHYNISHPGYVPGRYYQGFKNIATSTSSTAGFIINFISYYLFTIHHKVTLTRLAVSVVTSVADTDLRLGVYSNQDGIPKDLLIDSGNIATETSGIKEAIILLPSTPGDYWLGGVTFKAPNLHTCASNLATNYDLGQSTPTISTANSGLRNTLAVAPNTMPISAPVDNLYYINGNNRPLFWFKAG
ncbi:hypothetical protein [Nostoc sp. WHI]|uniref:hypothetical protein n=1 Tax=Nostoc sp. WHI TaxID=2650611 RepID=UPI0018C4F4BF|nr:hypothetical protein [Nostoc sp. WHI]MBG1268255.1 hypothetical protein [Nostoc sp. WHI]